MKPEIDGFLALPKEGADGKLYRGRLSLPNAQWTGAGTDVVATFTITLEQIADAAESRILWTDQSVQRGIVPTAPSSTPTELALSEGYPDENLYIFDGENADDMAEKILRGERLFLNPLVWNLRPGAFEAYRFEDNSETLLYSGKIYLPDSHHRHQAILKAVRSYRDHPSGYPKFDITRQFKIELYFLDREDEGNYFYDKNQRPKPTALSKAYDLTTEDDLSTLAKRVLELNANLSQATNRVTDRLSKKAPYFITLSTLREVMRTFAGGSEVEDAQFDGLAAIAAEFFEMLAEVRPELKVQTAQADRSSSLASAAVMMHAYGALMQDYSLDRAKLGPAPARRHWEKLLSQLAPSNSYSIDSWTGDFFDQENPLWQDIGVVQIRPKTGALTVANNGGTRARAGQTLRDFVNTGVLEK
ncbi:hypothetical protein ESZ53_01615 [Salinibacterium sp. UTAS2018]|uniref:DNA sulfur modification protein DndB n=1 Tax=Salinibacterium sp. UTAS2018 TaxID=2508880 RepID=UPI001009524A|nr:DNA sulfur modification protein DndB [Salinibacterium sp. UTAS2018]QAV69252.1 hypothetical protein ESZ53_01615 [Salinibacterium sp. UTAS2018]